MIILSTYAETLRSTVGGPRSGRSFRGQAVSATIIVTASVASVSATSREAKKSSIIGDGYASIDRSGSSLSRCIVVSQTIIRANRIATLPSISSKPAEPTIVTITRIANFQAQRATDLTNGVIARFKILLTPTIWGAAVLITVRVSSVLRASDISVDAAVIAGIGRAIIVVITDCRSATASGSSGHVGTSVIQTLIVATVKRYISLTRSTR